MECLFSILNQKKITPGNGFTLVEVVLAIGVVGIVMAASATLIGKTFTSSNTNKITTNLNLIIMGINDYRIIKKTLPTGTVWPAALNDFIDSTIRTVYGYNCPAGGSIDIVTDAGHSLTALSKLQDQNLCSSVSSIAQDGTITCRLVTFDGEICP